MIDIASIVSAVVAALTAGGWLVSANKRRQDAETHRAALASKEAELRASLRDSETKYTREALEIYTTQVIQPLRDEINRLRENQIRFQTAINAAPTCRIYPDCPVLHSLQASRPGDTIPLHRPASAD